MKSIAKDAKQPLLLPRVRAVRPVARQAIMRSQQQQKKLNFYWPADKKMEERGAKICWRINYIHFWKIITNERVRLKKSVRFNLS